MSTPLLSRSLRHLSTRPLPRPSLHGPPRKHSRGITTTVSMREQKTSPKNDAPGSKTPGGNSEPPKFDLSSLGASRNAKIFIIVVLSILGTMETMFWCRVIYEKFFAKDVEEGEGENEGK